MILSYIPEKINNGVDFNQEFSFWCDENGQTQGLPLRWHVNPHWM